MALPPYVHPPSLKSVLPKARTPISEIPSEWFVEIEPHIARPDGWDGCWYWSHRRSQEKLKTGATPAPIRHPYTRIWELGPDGKWKSRSWQVRPYIGRIFWEWRAEETHWVRGSVRKRRDGSEYYVANNRPRTQWEIVMSCGNPYCVNPSHFEFRNIRDRTRGHGLNRKGPAVSHREQEENND